MTGHPENLYIPGRNFDSEAYYKTGDFAQKWLPRLGGYDYNMQEKLPHIGGAILAIKHSGMMDIPLSGLVALEAYDRWIRFLDKRQLWEIPLVGRYIGDRFYERGGISFDRKIKLDEQPARSQVDQVLENGEYLGLFVEGTRVPGRVVGKIKKV